DRECVDRDQSPVPKARRRRDPGSARRQTRARGRGARRRSPGPVCGGSVMAAKYVAAIDHGTSSTRCILFTRNGRPAAIAQREQTMFYPRPGWVELDMGQVWEGTRACIHEALAAAGASAADVAA